jgi:hypothetical protein
MSDRTRIAAGLGVFLVLAAYPLWSALGATPGGAPPVLEAALDPSGCVEDTAYMSASHQQLLNEWRNAVVRDGELFYTSRSGDRWEMSLSGTCLQCHADYEGFCQRCHDYAAVEPRCWSCHLTAGGG